MDKKPQALTDAGVGRALFTTRFRLTLQAVLMCLTVGALPGFVLPYVVWFCVASDTSVDVVRLNMVADVVSQTTRRKWRLRDASGVRRVVEFQTADDHFVQWMTPVQARKVLAPLASAQAWFDLVAWSSLFTAGLGYFGTLRFLRRLGSGSQENQRIRGASLVVTGPELSALVKRTNGGCYRLADVLLPKEAPVTGIVLQGAQGSGKTVAFHDLVGQVLKKKRKCIFYDQTGEFFRAYFRPGKDFFFNPAFEGSVPWSIFSELRHNHDADSMARAFLPPKAGVVAGAGGFFDDAARALFSVILLRMAERGAVDTCDLARAFLEMPDANMNHLVANSVASSAVGGDSKGQRQGVVSSIAIYLNGLAAVQRGTWSIRDFVDGPDDSRLFILGMSDTRAQFAPLYRLLLTVAFSFIEARAELVDEDRYWFWLDECHTLGDIRLDEQLATLRKYGVAIVSGIQSDTQFVSSLGKDRAATVSNCFNTALLLRANDADMQERCARRLSKVEMDTVSRNQALAVTEWRDGAGLNKSEHEKWLVMPADFGQLKPCTGYLKMGEYPAAKVNYRSWITPSLTGGCHADDFKPVQPLPPMRRSLEVVRAATNDLFGDVDAEVKAQQAAKAAEASLGFPLSASPSVEGPVDPAAPKRFGGGIAGKHPPAQASLEIVPGEPASGEPPADVDAVQGADVGHALGAQEPQAQAEPQAENDAEQDPKRDPGHSLERGIDPTHLGGNFDPDLER